MIFFDVETLPSDLNVDSMADAILSKIGLVELFGWVGLIYLLSYAPQFLIFTILLSLVTVTLAFTIETVMISPQFSVTIILDRVFKGTTLFIKSCLMLCFYLT